jgi:hypothetical protein
VPPSLSVRRSVIPSMWASPASGHFQAVKAQFVQSGQPAQVGQAGVGKLSLTQVQALQPSQPLRTSTPVAGSACVTPERIDEPMETVDDCAMALEIYTVQRSSQSRKHQALK